MRFIATLVVVVLAALPVLFAGWPGASPAFFDSLPGGVPGSIAVMSALLLVFILIAGVCSGIAKSAGAADREAGR